MDSNTTTGLIYNDLNSTTLGRYLFTVTGGVPQTAAPTTLTVNPATGDFADTTTVSAVLTNSSTSAPIAGQSVTFTLNGTETCTGTTDATGTASCAVTPGEAAGTYTLSASFAGNSDLSESNGSANFVVTTEETALSYTGATSALNGQPVTLSGVLTTDDPTAGTVLPGKIVSFTLGSGSTAQTCSGTTDPTGTASCTIAAVNQTPGAVPVSASFAGDSFYQLAKASSTVGVGTVPTTLTVEPAAGDFADSTMVAAVLTNSNTSGPVEGKSVTFTLNATESCTARPTPPEEHPVASRPVKPSGRTHWRRRLPVTTTSRPAWARPILLSLQKRRAV